VQPDNKYRRLSTESYCNDRLFYTPFAHIIIASDKVRLCPIHLQIHGQVYLSISKDGWLPSRWGNGWTPVT